MKNMNFSKKEVKSFFDALDFKCMKTETSRGNVEFIPASAVGMTGMVPFRLCRNQNDGKIYLCRVNGYNTPMFIIPGKTKSVEAMMGDKEGVFTWMEKGTFEKFDTMLEAAARFNKYAKKKGIC